MRTILGLVLLLVALGSAQAKGWYVGTYGGANWNDVISSPIVNDKTGIVIGGVVGTTIDAVKGLRVEADMSFRHNEVDIFGGFITADHDTFALMGNVVYDVPINLGPMHPFVLAGLGYGHTEATFENVSLLKLESSGVAYQLGVGLNTQIADGIVFGVGYRFVQAPDISVFGTELSDGTNHSVVASLGFAFE